MLLEMLCNQIQPHVFKGVQRIIFPNLTMTTSPLCSIEIGGRECEKRILYSFFQRLQKHRISFNLCINPLFPTFLFKNQIGAFRLLCMAEGESRWICKNPTLWIESRLAVFCY